MLNTRSIDITVHISLHIQMQYFFLNTSEYALKHCYIVLAHCTLSSESWNMTIFESEKHYYPDQEGLPLIGILLIWGYFVIVSVKDIW